MALDPVSAGLTVLRPFAIRELSSCHSNVSDAYFCNCYFQDWAKLLCMLHLVILNHRKFSVSWRTIHSPFDEIISLIEAKMKRRIQVDTLSSFTATVLRGLEWLTLANLNTFQRIFVVILTLIKVLNLTACHRPNDLMFLPQK